MSINKKFESIDPIKKLVFISGGIMIFVVFIMLSFTLTTEMMSARDTIVNIIGAIFMIILLVISIIVLIGFVKLTNKTFKQLEKNK